MGKMKEMAAETQLAPMSGGMESPNKMIERVIKKNWSKMEAVMPKHLSSERLMQLTISAVNKTPKLLECDLATLLSCVMRCSALGLEPSAVDGLGYAYILPYKNKGKMEATFILGYKGMIKLAYMGGEVTSIEARAVHEGDVFDYRFGLTETLEHVPKGNGELTHVYMVARFKNGGHYFDVMTKDEVESIRKRSRAGETGAWVSDYEAMAKKTVVRRAFPYLPLPPMAQRAAEIDESDGGYVETLVAEPIMEATGAAAEDGCGDEADGGRAEAGTATETVRSARCRTCGNVQDSVAPDATLEDLDGFLCCEAPSYEWCE